MLLRDLRPASEKSLELKAFESGFECHELSKIEGGFSNILNTLREQSYVPTPPRSQTWSRKKLDFIGIGSNRCHGLYDVWYAIDQL